jgi:hypothetical protein
MKDNETQQSQNRMAFDYLLNKEEINKYAGNFSQIENSDSVINNEGETGSAINAMSESISSPKKIADGAFPMQRGEPKAIAKYVMVNCEDEIKQSELDMDLNSHIIDDLSLRNEINKEDMIKIWNGKAIAIHHFDSVDLVVARYEAFKLLFAQKKLDQYIAKNSEYNQGEKRTDDEIKKNDYFKKILESSQQATFFANPSKTIVDGKQGIDDFAIITGNLSLLVEKFKNTQTKNLQSEQSSSSPTAIVQKSQLQEFLLSRQDIEYSKSSDQKPNSPSASTIIKREQRVDSSSHGQASSSVLSSENSEQETSLKRANPFVQDSISLSSSVKIKREPTL